MAAKDRRVATVRSARLQTASRAVCQASMHTASECHGMVSAWIPRVSLMLTSHDKALGFTRLPCVCVCVCVCVSACLSVCLSVSMSLCLCVSASTYVPVSVDM
jgi:hypothetical protein